MSFCVPVGKCVDVYISPVLFRTKLAGAKLVPCCSGRLFNIPLMISRVCKYGARLPFLPFCSCWYEEQLFRIPKESPDSSCSAVSRRGHNPSYAAYQLASAV